MEVFGDVSWTSQVRSKFSTSRRWWGPYFRRCYVIRYILSGDRLPKGFLDLTVFPLKTVKDHCCDSSSILESSLVRDHRCFLTHFIDRAWIEVQTTPIATTCANTPRFRNGEILLLGVVEKNPALPRDFKWYLKRSLILLKLHWGWARPLRLLEKLLPKVAFRRSKAPPLDRRSSGDKRVME